MFGAKVIITLENTKKIMFYSHRGNNGGRIVDDSLLGWPKGHLNRSRLRREIYQIGTNRTNNI